MCRRLVRLDFIFRWVCRLSSCVCVYVWIPHQKNIKGSKFIDLYVVFIFLFFLLFVRVYDNWISFNSKTAQIAVTLIAISTIRNSQNAFCHFCVDIELNGSASSLSSLCFKSFRFWKCIQISIKRMFLASVTMFGAYKWIRSKWYYVCS